MARSCREELGVQSPQRVTCVPAGIVPAGEGDHELSLQYIGQWPDDRSIKADIYGEQKDSALEEATKSKEGPTPLQAVGEEREEAVALGPKGTLGRARRGRNVPTGILGQGGYW